MHIYICVHMLLTAVRSTKPISDHFGHTCGFDVKKISSDFMKEHVSVYVSAC